MGRRRVAREYALQFLYGLDFISAQEESQGSIQEYLASHSSEQASVLSFAEVIIRGVCAMLSDIDALIQRVAEKWDIDRMAVIDKAILRIAIYELLDQPTTPTAVIINEAIEIAKKYSTADSASFINGILDKIAREKRKGTASTVPNNNET